MGKRDKRVDAYIKRSAPFAKPILNYLREVVHRGCPETEETIKWGSPHFDYKGIMAAMAAFKHHCAFGFWKASLFKDAKKRLRGLDESAAGNFGRIEKLADLPSESVLLDLVREAAILNDKGITVKRKPVAKDKKPLVVPDYFKKELRKNNAAAKTFEGMTYSQQKDYLEWITEAKTEETRAKRMATTIEWLSEGKSRNWKYAKK